MHKSQLITYFILIYLLGKTGLLLYAQPKNIHFKHLNIDDGLSQNGVHAICQDSKGFMWFGTKAGLNKYDGYQFTNYKNGLDDSSSISNSTINSIYEDDQEDLLIGTYGGGLNIYNRKTDNFTSYLHDPKDSTSINGNFVECIYQDRQGNYWIGTTQGINLFDKEAGTFRHFLFDEDNTKNIEANSVRDIMEDSRGDLWFATQFYGLVKFDRETHKMKYYQHDKEDSSSLPGNYVWTIYEDEYGNFWVGTYGNGLALFDREKETFQHYQHDARQKNSLGDDHITLIYEDSKGRLWIGTDGAGLSTFDKENEKFTHYVHDENQQNSLGGNVILSMYEDDQGIIWVGTLYAGLSYHYNTKFKHYHKIKGHNSLSHNIVTQIYGDTRGMVWIGTDKGGLNRFNPDTEHFKHFTYSSDSMNGISSNTILAITEDKNNELWFGTYGGGISIYNPEQSTFRYYQHDPKDPESLAYNYIWSLLTDSQDKIWAGVYTTGLGVYNPHKDGFDYYTNAKNDTTSLTGNLVVEIYEDSHKQLWVGTSHHGLNMVDISDYSYGDELNFKRFKHDRNDPTSLSNNQVRAVFEDSKGNIWVGTNGGGLNLYQPDDEVFVHFTDNDGLPSNVIQSILEDNSGNLWISTSHGLSRFNPETGQVRNYDTSDGLQSYEFSRYSSSFRDDDGTMYFGGVNGFNTFFPDSLQYNEYVPPVVITGFSLFNKPVKVGTSSLLKEHISETREIVLSHKQTVFSLEFTALNYKSPEKNEYAYKLIGFDESWNEVGANRTATYTNLDAGKYTFHVKASNNDGVWNEQGAMIDIIILPPWWETWWFKLLVVFTIVFGIVGIYRYRVHKIERQKADLEQQVNAKTNELKSANKELLSRTEHLAKKNQELDEFAYIVSHDLKAPLRGINNLTDWIVEDLEDGNEGEVKENIATLKNRVGRMKDLIDGILQYSRAGRKDTEITQVDTRAILDLVLNTIEIPDNFKMHIADDLPVIQCNETWVEQVFSNLINNAIKYHDKPQGNIYVDCQEDDNNTYVFAVSDDGPGIPEESREKIFAIFQTLQSKDTVESTGVGLSIVKKIVEELGGKIWVEGMPEGGSKFLFTIPK